MDKAINNLHIPRRSGLPGKEITVLAGDIGGTKTHLALFNAGEEGMRKISEKKYASKEYNTLTEIINQFVTENKSAQPDRISLGVAGPVMNGKVTLTNLNWKLDSNDIAGKTNVKDVYLLNDLESFAYGIGSLDAGDFEMIHAGDKNGNGNMAIIAPGTGLGEAGLYWSGQSHFPFPTEGGHCYFAPRTEEDIELLRFLQKKYGVVSWEKVITGPAIHDIYCFLRDVKGKEEPGWLKKELQDSDDPSAMISNTAIENKAAICVETMEHFVRHLAHESANLVLKLKATGGLFLGGGIPPKIAPLLTTPAYFQHYLDCDRMQHLLETVPIRIIKNDDAGLLGAAYYGAYCN